MHVAQAPYFLMDADAAEIFSIIEEACEEALMADLNMFTKIAGAAIAALVIAPTAASAGGACLPGHSCYRKVTAPAVYGTYSRSVMVRPPQTSFEKIPAQYGTASQQVLVRPAQRIAHRHPAVMRQVAERVMVQPATRVWSVTRDHHGREIGCWITKPAVYATQYRTIVVRPETVSYSVIPAEYRMETRQVVISPARLIQHTTPPVYATQTYQAQISPATTSWQPVGHGARAGYRGDHHRYRHYR